MDEARRSKPASGKDPSVIGRTIAGKFLIESYIGGGAMGAVYRARQTALDKDVAVKLLHGEHAGDATFAARFHREAKAASRLDHPNSLRVIDFGEEPDGLLYIAMEYLDGRDLFHVIKEDWPISAARAADVLSQALAAVAVAHEMGIVHRDLKPENIMVLPGTTDDGHPRDLVKVCDFGIAKFTDAREARASGGAKLTTQGIVVGTPEYMSPEQGKGEALDARSDIYAMGVILYQLLTGRVPFDAETALGVVLKHVTEDPVPPRQVNPAADAKLEAICLRAMQKKREDRYPSARVMRQEVRAVLGQSDPLAHAATVELSVPPSGIAHASTALAIDSGAIAAAAAATGSKLTPLGTVTAAQPATGGRGRATVVAVAVLALVAGGLGVWVVKVRKAPPVPAAAVAPAPHVVAPPPPTTLEPLRATTTDLPPLEVTTASAHAKTPPAGAAHGGGLPPAATRASEPRENAAATPLTPAPAPAGSAVPAVIPAAPPASVAAAPAPAPVPGPAPSGSGLSATSPATGPVFDPSHAHVDWAVSGAGGGATVGAVQRALARRAGAWTQCYKKGLEHRNERIDGAAVMHLATDDTGNVVSVGVNGFDAMPGVKSCVAGAARVRIEGVDTGDAWADVQLTFRAE